MYLYPSLPVKFPSSLSPTNCTIALAKVLFRIPNCSSIVGPESVKLGSKSVVDGTSFTFASGCPCCGTVEYGGRSSSFRCFLLRKRENRVILLKFCEGENPTYKRTVERSCRSSAVCRFDRSEHMILAGSHDLHASIPHVDRDRMSHFNVSTMPRAIVSPFPCISNPSHLNTLAETRTHEMQCRDRSRGCDRLSAGISVLPVGSPACAPVSVTAISPRIAVAISPSCRPPPPKTRPLILTPRLLHISLSSSVYPQNGRPHRQGFQGHGTSV